MRETLNCRLHQLFEKTDRHEDIMAELEQSGDQIDTETLRFILASETNSEKRIFSILDAVEI